MTRLLSTAALVLGLTLAMPGVALAVPTPPTGSDWAEFFLPRSSDPTKCMDVPRGSTAAGTEIEMYRCHGYAGDGGPQRWTFVRLSDGSYQVFNQKSRMCLTPHPRPGSAGNGYLVQEPCYGAFPGNAWRLEPVPLGPDQFRLRNAWFTGLCLTGRAEDHALVQLTPCGVGSEQRWQFG